MIDKPVIEESVNGGLGAMEATFAETMDRLVKGDATVVLELTARYLIPASAALVSVFIGYLVAKYLARIISTPVCKRVDETLGKFIGRVVFYGVMLSVVALVLNVVGFRMGGLATILAAAGFAIGLAFQGTLSNFAAGVLLLVFRPFKVGDLINAAGMMGRVNEIDLFTTTLDTPDNRRIIIPNSSISGGTIENISYHAHRRIEVVVGVAYAANLDATRAALTRAAESLRDRLIDGDGRGYTILLATLADSSVQWKVRFWALSQDFFPVTELLTQAVKRNLDDAGITIAFPQLDVHVHRVDAGSEAIQPSHGRTRLSSLAQELRRAAS